MKELDLLKLELYFTKLKLPYFKDFKIKHRDILNQFYQSLQDGKPLKTIKRELHKALNTMYTELKIPMEILALEQLTTIESGLVVSGDITVMGLTLDEMLTKRLHTHLQQLINKSVSNTLVLNEVKRSNANTFLSLAENYNKAVREHGYNEFYKKYKKKVKGWLYTSIMDRRTTPLCIGLANRFYPIERYPNRGDCPYIPAINTHLRCRSSLLAIYELEEIKEYKGLTLHEFLKTRPIEAKKMLGEKKYNLFKDNKLPINSVYDLKNKRFFTNKEIKEHL